MSEGTPPPYGDQKAMTDSILGDVKQMGDILEQCLHALPEKVRQDQAAALIKRLEPLAR